MTPLTGFGRWEGFNVAFRMVLVKLPALNAQLAAIRAKYAGPLLPSIIGPARQDPNPLVGVGFFLDIRDWYNPDVPHKPAMDGKMIKTAQQLTKLLQATRLLKAAGIFNEKQAIAFVKRAFLGDIAGMAGKAISGGMNALGGAAGRQLGGGGGIGGAVGQYRGQQMADGLSGAAGQAMQGLAGQAGGMLQKAKPMLQQAMGGMKSPSLMGTGGMKMPGMMGGAMKALGGAQSPLGPGYTGR